MSLAARCPWCETVFRLTEGQVSAKGGMARCGVCNHTFNALDALLSDSAVAALERGAQAREANQEATARANEQGAAKPAEAIPRTNEHAGARPAEAIPIPMSIRKVFGALGSPAPAPMAPIPIAPAPMTAAPAAPVPIVAAPVVSAPPPSLTSASLSALRAAFSSAPPEKNSGAVAMPPAVTAPTTVPTSAAAPAPAAIPVAEAVAPAPAPAAQASLPEQHVEPLQPPAPYVAPPAAPTATPLAAANAVTQSSQTPSVDSSSAEAASSEPSANAAPEPASAPIPIDYKVEMPNYDADRAIALAEAERLQKEQQELEERRKKSQDADVPVEDQLDAIQSALSPPPAAELPERDPVDPAPAAATLNSLRLQHAAVHAASANEVLREEERLGPNTFQPSFLNSNQPSGRFLRTRRFFGSVLILALFLALLAQAAYWWRSDLAVKMPQSKPYLVKACQRLHCEVDPPAQIDLLSIESSELVATPNAAGSLNFTALVRNHSVNALAYPAIEITLTDARDQAILRRVFLPTNYLGDPLGTKRLAGIPGNSEYTLKLTFSTSGVATSGYRAGIFYP